MPAIPLIIDSDHPCFAGHFPGRPIVPGVLLLDRALRAIESATGLTLDGLPVAKFLGPAQPGDRLDVEFRIDEASVHFEIKCETRTLASGRFSRARYPLP